MGEFDAERDEARVVAVVAVAADVDDGVAVVVEPAVEKLRQRH